jgi:ABC-type uncharacterized transport system involved in gliding motility auxiliary subunit
MKEQLKKADLYGLIILAAAMVVYMWREVWTVYQTIAAVVGGLLIVASLVLKAAEIRTSLGRRSTRIGIHSGISVLAVLGILALVNYLGQQHYKQIDMTEEKLYSLSDQSLKVIEEVKEDVTIKGFFPGGENARAKDILSLYSGRNKKISFELIDPEKHPQLAKQYDITTYGTLIAEMGGNKQRIQKEQFVEEDVTNALTKLVKGGKKTVYFTEGHGENQIGDTGQNGFSLAQQKLENDNYTVKTLSLAREGKVPADASLVVVAGPKSEPFPAELDALNEYLKGGGSVMLLLDPPESAALADFARGWSIDVGNNMVIDRSLVSQLSGTNPVWALVQNYGPHKITSDFRNGYTLLPMARSITPIKPPVEGVTVDTLLSTSQESWAESDIKSIQPGKTVGLDSKDIPGPVTLGVAVSKEQGPDKKSRLVVIGDADFASNQFYSQQLNGDLFINSVAWLASDESFISIRAKDPTNRAVTMTTAQSRMFLLISLILLPGAILMTGISVWASRRK